MTMAQSSDPRIAEAHRHDMDQLIQRLDIRGLKRGGVERTGPCPRCGGTDRFSVNTRKQQFLCRACDSDGGKGDQIALVMFVLGMDFGAALEWLCGPRVEISAEERAKRDLAEAENRRKKDMIAAHEREKAIRLARGVWQCGKAAESSPVRDYLICRGIAPTLFPRLPICLRYHPDLAYTVEIDRAWQVIHRGPAMLAAIQGPDGKFIGVHRTWIDLDQPKGKARILHPVTGEVCNAKKMLGSKKGGTIRLTGNAVRPVLVMGEGIETTLSALVSGVHADAAFWAGADLGNMAGQRMMGKGQRFDGIPDLGDRDAFVPPPGVDRLIYVMDGDSEPKSTRAKLVAGLRRAMALRPGLRGQIAACPSGVDLNDVLLGGGNG
jgi:hypothetical protein